MSKIKNDGLDQYGAKPFEQKQFGTAGDQGVNGIGGERVNQKPCHCVHSFITVACLFLDMAVVCGHSGDFWVWLS